MDPASVVVRWAAFDDGGWTPGIGDPTFMGWLTVAAYAIGAGLCALCALRAAKRQASLRDRILWWVLAAILVAFGINKQLDLQSLVLELARDLAKEQGWYEDRRTVQLAFITFIALAGAAFVAVVLRVLRGAWREHALPLVGVTLLVVFVVVRAASFHKLDLVLTRLPGWIIELGAISLIAAGALRAFRRLRGLERRGAGPRP
jgi:FtsH-binding integral membrane protein